ncbi:hypothetical protein Clacol_008363 [Clathrus columnatus]|uniref:Uncharacterized protein n=1 Tax=Clathrus columnatus TaxID=1419009 RepID=A0AAV5ANX6_9AGAM|nr:hypothetical protein Clacol_008363 [Clathrus columnatus]
MPSNNRLTWISLLLLITTYQVHARTCFENGFGDIECNGLSNGARIGIAVAIIVVAFIGLAGLAYWRKRRAQDRNLVYLTHPAYPNYNYDTRGGGQTYNRPQYPPQVYAEQPYNSYTAPYTGYDTGYKPQFGPPPGSPPVTKN